MLRRISFRVLCDLCVTGFFQHKELKTGDTKITKAAKLIHHYVGYKLA